MKKKEGYWLEFSTEVNMDYKPIYVTVMAKGKVWREMYGADADGNRGEMRTEVEILDVKFLNSEGKDVTEVVESFDPNNVDHLLEEIEQKFLEDYDE